MTRQEFDEAYNNGYIHGYAAGRSDLDLLDKIRAEIAENGNSDINARTVLAIIDKYRKGDKKMSKGALNVDKAIWELYENIPHLLCEQPYGKNGRYITYYAEERLYLVFDLWYHGFFLVEADSPKDAIGEVNCDRLKYVPKEKE